MKKLLFGLLLTVGCSAFALANNKDEIKDDNFLSTAEFNNDEATISCTTYYYVRIVTCSGENEDYRIASENGDCGNYEEGSTTFRKVAEFQEECGPQ